MKSLRKQAIGGFTLVEILISVGISSITILAVAVLLSHVFRLDAQMSAINIVEEEVILLSKKLHKTDNCSLALSGVNFDPTVATDSNLTPSEWSKLNINLGNSKIKLKSVKLHQVTKLQSVALVGESFDSYLVDLVLSFEAANSSIYLLPSQLEGKKIPLNLVVQASTKTVISCVSSYEDLKSYCTLIGGVYSSGQSPPCRLPIYNGSCASHPLTPLASGFDPAIGIKCTSPHHFPGVGTISPAAASPGDSILRYASLNCSGKVCNCPTSTPEFVSADYSVNPAKMVCKGFSTIPLSSTESATMACLTANAGNKNCLKLDGVRIRMGFGPCLNCP